MKKISLNKKRVAFMLLVCYTIAYSLVAIGDSLVVKNNYEQQQYQSYIGGS